ncbi:MAG: DUF3306 domain-containing protein [Betaproteobacteria bacterium]
MPDIPNEPKGFSLRRWSQRKHAARSTAAEPATPAVPVRAEPLSNPAVVRASDDTEPHAVADAPAASIGPDGRPALELPSLDSLTIDSDYSPFMQSGVDDASKCGALRKLFSDPRFNVMDGLDVYVGDYSKPDPIDAAVVRTLVQGRYLFDPPATRVNAAGYVEDIPDDVDGVVDTAAPDVSIAGPGDAQGAPAAAGLPPAQSAPMAVGVASPAASAPADAGQASNDDASPPATGVAR